MRRACVLLKKTAKKRLLRHTAREPALPTAGCSRAGATVPPCPGAARPSSQLGRLPQDLRLPFVVSAWLDNLRRHGHEINSNRGDHRKS